MTFQVNGWTFENQQYQPKNRYRVAQLSSLFNALVNDCPLNCSVPRDTPKRIQNNLVENAIRYGGQNPVTIHLQQEVKGLSTICIPG